MEFFADGTAVLQSLTSYLSVESTHILDWFHLTMRLVKRQQVQSTKKGAHLLVQAHTKVLTEDLEDCFRQQYPGFRPLPAEPLLMAA